jgi:hypothetical protein
VEAQPAVRSGVFLVRVWVEDDSLRARITESLDGTARDRTTLAVAGNEEIEASLHDWLQSFSEPVTRQ